MGNAILRAAACSAMLLWAAASFAVTAAEKCEASKLATAGKYGFCRLNAEAKAVKSGAAPDYSKCDAKFSFKWGLAESKAGAGVCPSEGDQTTLQTFVTQHTDDVATLLAGGTPPTCAPDLCGNGNIDPGEDCDQSNLNSETCVTRGFVGGTLACGSACTFNTSGCVSTRFVDNGDGTVTDYQRGIVWEKKTDDSTVHDSDNVYTWSASGTAADGSAFSNFLNGLNSAVSADGSVVTGCFAGRCDWRLPTSAELQSILDCGPPCFPDPILGQLPTLIPVDYWSSTTSSAAMSDAWKIEFFTGATSSTVKTGIGHARAVSGPAQLFCGNGVIDAGEACDQSDLNLASCESLGFPLGGTLACTLACAYDTSGCLPCPGAMVGGACWVLGAQGADCNATCAGIAAGVTYDPATDTYAGSAGTTLNCQAVVTGLSIPLSVIDEPSCPAGVGCGLVSVTMPFPTTLAIRCPTPATTATATDPDVVRICACF